MTTQLIEDAEVWIGEEIKWFYWVKRLKGTVNCILAVKLKNGDCIPHPVHLREGMTIRNWMRSHPDCESMSDFDHAWIELIDILIERYKVKRNENK